MTETIAALAAAWLVAVVGGTAAVLVVDRRRTTRPPVRVGTLRSSVRWARAVTLRGASAVLSWPHLVDVALGTTRTPMAPTPAQAVMTFGPATLLRYDSDAGGPPVLVVHSLVTRPWVLDLTPERSMVGHLLARGLDVWLLDWGVAGRDEAMRTLDDHVATLADARDAVETSTGRPCQVVGYCLGATVAVLEAARAADPPRSLALVAPVVEVTVSEHSDRVAGIGRYMVLPWAAAGLALDHHGLVPGSVIRESFHLLRPRALRTIWSRLRMPRDPVLRRAYGAMSRWAWEQPALPGAAFLDLVALHRTNALARGALVDLDRLTMPVLVACSERDHIVASRAEALTARGAELIGFPGGHVGMLVGRQASALYDSLADFLERQAS